jgi:uncharacterized protein (DUF1810 family)
MKLRSSMTLFASVAEDPRSVFVQVLDRYFEGERDDATLAIMKGLHRGVSSAGS